jgi:hypothetical protein
VTVAFVYAFAFGHLSPNPSFNFVVPYAYSATYGMLVSTASLLFLIRHVQGERDRDLALSVLFLALAALTKLEALAPSLAAHGAWIVAGAWARRIGVRHALAYACGLALAALPYLLLALRAGRALWTDNLAAVVNTGSREHVFETMGLADPGRSLWLMAISAVALAVAAGVALATARLLRPERPTWVRVLATVGGGLLCFLLYLQVGSALTMRLLPALAVVVLAALAWRVCRKEDHRRDLPALLLWAFAATCLVRLGLLAGPAHYGFFLGPVPFLALALVLFRDLAARVGGEWGRRAVVGAGVGVVAGFTLSAFAVSVVLYADHGLEVRTPRGHMLLRGEPWQPEVVAFLARLPEETRIAVVPQGAGLIFLAGPRMAGGIYSYAPMELSGRYTDERVVERFRSDPPDVVVQLRQDRGSFRWTGFGVEYGHGMATFLGANYAPIAGSPEVIVLRYSGPPPRKIDRNQ